MRVITYRNRKVKDLHQSSKSNPGVGLPAIPPIGFLPAFLISHQNRFRRADFGDSFPPGEAIGRCKRQFSFNIIVGAIINRPKQGIVNRQDIEIGNLSNLTVIANQCAHWCGNPFPLK